MRIIIVLLCFAFMACNSTGELEQLNFCKSELPPNTEEKSDFKNNFKLQLPKEWNKSYFYSATTSELYTADTTKQLSEATILEFIFHDATLTMGSDLFNKIATVNRIHNNTLADSQEFKFQGKPAVYFTSKGKKADQDVLLFDLYVQTSENTYFNAKSEIYGYQEQQSRLCQSLSIINTVEFLK